jgi:hypothetical protein
MKYGAAMPPVVERVKRSTGFRAGTHNICNNCLEITAALIISPPMPTKLPMCLLAGHMAIGLAELENR